jgi:hypothetical protein
MKRLWVWLVSTLTSLSFLALPAHAQSASDYTQGVSVAGNVATIWFKPTGTTTSWVDVHYKLNGGAEQSFRMTYSSTAARHEQNVSPVAAGNVLGYWFTYNKGTPAYNSTTFSFTVGSTTPPPPPPPPPVTGTWNGMTTFNIVNQTNGKWADSQVFWSIIGKDWNSGRFVHVDPNGNLIPMALADNGQLVKNGQGYSNYFYSLAQTQSVTIPAINSARILFSVGTPMYVKVLSDPAGNVSYAGANIENPSDPNIDVVFDFGEMAILPKGSPSQGIYVNTSRVDQYGFPLKLRVQGLNSYDKSVGETLTEGREALFTKFIAETPAEFRGLAQTPYAPFRIMAPAHATFTAGQANANYLQPYIDAVWARYRNEDLVFTLENLGTFRGRVVGDRFTFTGGTQNGSFFINGKPTTSMALLGNGFLDDTSGGPTNAGTQLQIQAQICAAINRHVVEQPANWHNAAAFYPAGTAANWFAKFWHDHGINKLAYGFAYDDVGDFSPSLHTDSPTIVTFTIGW